MIRFSDITINEGWGNYRLIRELMESSGPKEWMIESHATISTPIISSDCVLHFWADGRVVLMETNHPLHSQAPDDDIRELSRWCRKNGWKNLVVDNKLITEQKEFEFWMRFYYSGMITSDVLKKHDEQEIERMGSSESEETDDVD